jgi:hypothetical protein
MRRRFLAICFLQVLAASALTVVGGLGRTPVQGAVVQEGDLVAVRYQKKPATAGVYAGRIKDVRPAWDLLILTVGKGKKARHMRFDIGEARIVGPDGNEWKAEDLKNGDRVRVELTADRKLVQQVTVLKD